MTFTQFEKTQVEHNTRPCLTIKMLFLSILILLALLSNILLFSGTNLAHIFNKQIPQKTDTIVYAGQ